MGPPASLSPLAGVCVTLSKEDYGLQNWHSPSEIVLLSHEGFIESWLYSVTKIALMHLSSQSPFSISEPIPHMFVFYLLSQTKGHGLTGWLLIFLEYIYLEIVDKWNILNVILLSQNIWTISCPQIWAEYYESHTDTLPPWWPWHTKPLASPLCPRLRGGIILMSYWSWIGSLQCHLVQSSIPWADWVPVSQLPNG